MTLLMNVLCLSRKKTWFFAVLLFLLSSCKTYKNIAYFQDIPDSVSLSIKTAAYHPLLIQKGDILNINIATPLDQSSSGIMNAAQTQGSSPVTQLMSAASGLSALGSSAGGSSQASNPSGYLVYDNGTIEIPMLGSFHTIGISTDSLRKLVEFKALEFYKMPTITVRFANLKVSVLGEVMRPGTFTLVNEKNSILDALAMAMDLSIFGKRENVLLIRDSAGITRVNRFSLNQKDLFKKDYFYLKQNDIIYVEPAKEKAAALDADKARIYGITAAFLSVLIVLATRL